MSVRRKQIRRIVNQVLEEMGIDGPLVPVKEIAEEHGVLVQETRAEDDLSGFIYVDSETDETVIGVNKSHGKQRKRFTIAHELGHMLLHDFDDLHVDRGFGVKLRNRVSSEGTDLEEKEANLFAAELLMPKDFIEDVFDEQGIEMVDLEDEKIISSLAKIFDVSVQAMTFRLMYLGYIDQ